MAHQRVRASSLTTQSLSAGQPIAKSLPAPIPSTIQGLVDETFHALSAARSSAHRILLGLRGPELNGGSENVPPRTPSLMQDLTDNLEVARDLHAMVDEITSILALSNGQADSPN